MTGSYSDALVRSNVSSAIDHDLLPTPMLKRIKRATHPVLGDYDVWVPALRVSEIENIFGDNLQLWHNFQPSDVIADAHRTAAAVPNYSAAMEKFFNRDIPDGFRRAFAPHGMHCINAGLVAQSLSTTVVYVPPDSDLVSVRCAVVVFDELFGDLDEYATFKQNVTTATMPRYGVALQGSWHTVSTAALRKDMRALKYKTTGEQYHYVSLSNYGDRNPESSTGSLRLFSRGFTKYKRNPPLTTNGEVKQVVAESYAMDTSLVQALLCQLDWAVDQHMGTPNMLWRPNGSYGSTGWHYAADALFSFLTNVDTLGLLPLMYKTDAYRELVNMWATATPRRKKWLREYTAKMADWLDAQVAMKRPPRKQPRKYVKSTAFENPKP